jgi:hypothetical protein
MAGCSAPLPAPMVVDAPAAPSPIPAPTIVSPDGLNPVDVVTEFYRWYLAYINSGTGGPRNPVAGGAFRETGYVAPEFAQQVEAAAAGAMGGFDPFLCAQDVPSEVIPVGVRDGETGAAVDVRTSFEGHKFTVALQQSEAAWRIINVICDAGEASPGPTPATVCATVVVLASPPVPEKPSVPEGWQVYRSETYRFQVGYPQGWVVREAASTEGQPPIGPQNMKLVVMLMPQEWAEQLDAGGPPDANAPVLAPFTLEVTVGSEEEFWANYPEPLAQEDAQLSNATAIRAVEKVSDEISIPRLVFRHPVAKELRVVLTDPISGFADRKATHPEVAAVFEKVANTFAWLD